MGRDLLHRSFGSDWLQESNFQHPPKPGIFIVPWISSLHVVLCLFGSCLQIYGSVLGLPAPRYHGWVTWRAFQE